MENKYIEEQLKKLESPLTSPRQKSIIREGLMLQNQNSLSDEDNKEFWERV